MQNFIQIALGVSVLRMRDFAPLGTKWLGYFWGGGGSWERVQPRHARTGFDAKYVKRRGSAQGSAFWGSRNQNLRLWLPFSPKPPFLGPISDNFFRPKTALTLEMIMKRYNADAVCMFAAMVCSQLGLLDFIICGCCEFIYTSVITPPPVYRGGGVLLGVSVCVFVSPPTYLRNCMSDQCRRICVHVTKWPLLDPCMGGWVAIRYVLPGYTVLSSQFSVAGPMAWNSLPDFIRDPTSSTDCFRRLLKTYLFARYYTVSQKSKTPNSWP